MFKIFGATARTMRVAAAAVSAAVVFGAPGVAGAYSVGSFSAVGSANNMHWEPTSPMTYGAGGKVTSLDSGGVPNVMFTFGNGNGDSGDQYGGTLVSLAALGPLQAIMSITSDPTVLGNHMASGMSTHQTVTFTYAGPTPLSFEGIDYLAGTKLLQVSYCGIGSLHGDCAAAGLSSDLFSFYGFVYAGTHMNMSLSGAPEAVKINGIDTYAAFDGRYGSGLIFGGIPEPTTWAMMIIGLGAVGAGIRTSRRRMAAA